MKAIIVFVIALVYSSEAIKVYHKGNSADYYFDEGPNNNVCKTDDDCDGLRKCSKRGECREKSR